MKNTNRVDTDGDAIQKLTSIIDYNHNMGGVDLVDQQLDSLDVLRKSYKWYKKLFLRLVMQCALASHKLYKKLGGKDDFLFFPSSLFPYYFKLAWQTATLTLATAKCCSDLTFLCIDNQHLQHHVAIFVPASSG